ncbi:MAG: PASTA domain-containing protein [Prevotella sp.]|nr:PASTA domain-containing protein [Prevotella sp.]
MNAKEFRQKLTSPLLWGNLLAMALVVVALIFGLIWWLSIYTHHNKTVEVPDLYGMDYSTAIERLKAEGLQLIANDSAYNKKLPAGSVLAQLPAKGATVKEGRTIYVTINSLTLSRLEIPDLIDNSSYREAQAKLQAMGFRLTEPRLIEGERDWVYGIQCNGRNVMAGDMVARESVLTLVIGNGLVADDYETADDSDAMSDFMGADSNEADDVDDFLEVTEED